MKGTCFFLSIIFAAGLAAGAHAEQAAGSPWLKSVGQVVVQTGVQALNPQAQAIVNQALQLAGVSQQENFIVTKAKAILGEKNFETALQLATYVLTNLNSKSLDAQKIATDAKAALTKMAQDKLTRTQAPADAQKTAEGVKGILGAFGTKK